MEANPCHISLSLKHPRTGIIYQGKKGDPLEEAGTRKNRSLAVISAVTYKVNLDKSLNRYWFFKVKGSSRILQSYNNLVGRESGSLAWKGSSPVVYPSQYYAFACPSPQLLC